MATAKKKAAVSRQRESKAAKKVPKTETTKSTKGKLLFKEPKIPDSFGKVADLLYSTREERLKLSKVVDAMEAFEKRLKNHCINNLPKSKSSGAAGKIARVQIVTEPVPQVEDWDKLYKHIKKTGDFSLLNRAPNRTAIRERWDNGKKVPGVESFTAVKVSVTKV